MTNLRNTKRALFSSTVALLICFAMLLGTTYAWFTDSVTSSGNKIVSGTLKVDLELLTKNEDGSTSWVSIKNEKTPLFNYNKWEPGYVDVKVLKIENEGSLALKWKAKFVGEVNELANVIDVYVLPSEEQELIYPTSRDLEAAGYKKVGTLAQFVETIETTTHGVLSANDCAYLGIALKMQETAGNDYQNKKIGEFDIMIVATQYTEEDDSFGTDYDENAMYPNELGTGKDIHNSTTSSGKFVLANDITTSDYGADARYGYGYEYIVRKGADYTLDLNGKTIVHDVVNENANHNALTYLLVANNAGTKLTIDGEGKIYCYNSEGYTCALQGKDGTLLTVNGGDYEVDNGIAVWAGAGAHIVINGGSFVNANATTDHELIYSSGGVIDIYGGFFHNTDGNYTLNVEDRNRTTSFINVYGGTYVNFDPSTGGQDPNNIKVADGYYVTSEKQDNGDIWYTVVPVPEGYVAAKTAEDITAAIAEGKNVVLSKDLIVTDTLNITSDTTIDLNGKKLTVSRLEAKAELIINGGILENGEATYPAISVNEGGTLTLNDATIVGGTPCNIVTSGSAQAAEIVGVEVFGGKCVLNNCDIIVNVEDLRYSNSVFAIGIHDGSLTMNGGSITVTSVGSTKPQYDYQSAIFAGSNTEKTITLNNVDVTAEKILYAWGGNTTLNTTDAEGTWDSTDFDTRNGGSYTVNYNYAG